MNRKVETRLYLTYRYFTLSLITNLQNRSSGKNLKAILTPAVYYYPDDPDPDATYLAQETCFKTTNEELAASGY